MSAVTKIRDRDQIVDAAAQLFSQKGYEATSLDDVAAFLGTARSALYYHVSGKAELRSLIQIRRVHMLVSDCHAIADSRVSAAEKLGDIARAHLAHFERFYPESKGWSFITTTPLVHDESSAALHAEQRKVHACIREVIEAGMASGEFRPADPSVAALGIIGMCNYVTTWFRPEGARSIAEVADVYAAMAVGALLNGGGHPHAAS
jgi:AcrR family transcriptional regulator